METYQAPVTEKRCNRVRNDSPWDSSGTLQSLGGGLRGERQTLKANYIIVLTIR